MPETTPEQAMTIIWWSSLGLGLVVSLVVTLLLWLIHREAGKINQHVAKIWDVGQRVANNTVHIPLLYKTNAMTGEILTTAAQIEQAADAIKNHADGCPGCPHCMLNH